MRFIQKVIEKFNISGKISQSFYGDDILLWRYFKLRNIRNGFFIDIGAYHPKFNNNTWRLRKQLGFRGINIEPTERIKLFRKYRKNDKNLQCLIGDRVDKVDFYYSSEEPQISGTDRSKLIKKPDILMKMWQTTLSRIVEQYNVTKIDLLDIDIEGTEMEVLRGYDWSVMPRLILIEDDKDTEERIKPFLTMKGYKIIAHTINNALYEYGISND